VNKTTTYPEGQDIALSEQ